MCYYEEQPQIKTLCSSVAILFSLQVPSTAQGPFQLSPGMTSPQSQFIYGGEEVYPTFELIFLTIINKHIHQSYIN